MRLLNPCTSGNRAWLVLGLAFCCLCAEPERPRRSQAPRVTSETRPPEAPASLLSQIASANLRALPTAAPEGRKPRGARKKLDPYAGLTALEELIARKQPAAMRQRSFAILAEAEKPKAQDPDGPREPVLDRTTIADLNIVLGSPEHPGINLASVLGKGARTDLGRAYLASLIARPTDQVETLLKRQNLIRALGHLSEGDRERLLASLKAFGANENYLVGLWGENLPQLFPQKDYFTSLGASYLNESSTALQAKAYLGHLKAAGREGMKALSAGLLMIYGVATFLELEAPYHADLSSYADRNLGSLIGRGAEIPIPKEMSSALTYIEQPQVRGAMMASVGFNSAKMLNNSIKTYHSELLQHDVLLKRVMHIAQLMQAMETIHRFLHEQPQLSSSLVFYPGLDAFFKQLPESQPRIARLFELLKTGTFSREPDEVKRYLFNYGRVLVATKLLTEIEEHLAAPLAAVAELDTDLALADLMESSEPGGPSFCFPEYLDHPRPKLSLVEVWNPFVPRQQVVANSITLDEDGADNMVLTGPNSSGKSTVLKSIAIGLVLAQSAGIAPARQLSFTPFANISTYMNVTDNSIDQESLFQAEAKRVFNYGDVVKALGERKAFSFAIFDEIFSGTTPEEGTSLALKVAKALAGYDNNISIIATHFKDLARRLEAETAGRFRNYKTSVTLGPGGQIGRSYTLEPGISDQHIAESIFREKGLDSPFFKDLSHE